MEDVSFGELRSRLGEEGLAIVDVRSPYEFEGRAGAPCDPKQGHIAGAVNVPLETLMHCATVDDVRAAVGLPEGTEVIAYCHSGSRSHYAVEVLREAGYRARNYVGSWHEWSRRVPLPEEAELD